MPQDILSNLYEGWTYVVSPFIYPLALLAIPVGFLDYLFPQSTIYTPLPAIFGYALLLTT